MHQSGWKNGTKVEDGLINVTIVDEKMVQSGGCMINATKVDEKWRLHSFSRALVKREKASEAALLSLHVAYAACSLFSLSPTRARGSIFFSEVPFSLLWRAVPSSSSSSSPRLPSHREDTARPSVSPCFLHCNQGMGTSFLPLPCAFSCAIPS